MPVGTDDSRIHAEAIVKAACINAAATLIAAGKIGVPADGSNIEKTVAYSAMDIWASLEKPANWPA
jgi:hypothetical protein